MNLINFSNLNLISLGPEGVKQYFVNEVGANRKDGETLYRLNTEFLKKGRKTSNLLIGTMTICSAILIVFIVGIFFFPICAFGWWWASRKNKKMQAYLDAGYQLWLAQLP